VIYKSTRIIYEFISFAIKKKRAFSEALFTLLLYAIYGISSFFNH